MGWALGWSWVATLRPVLLAVLGYRGAAPWLVRLGELLCSAPGSLHLREQPALTVS